MFSWRGISSVQGFPSLSNEMSIAWCFQNVQRHFHNKRYLWAQQVQNYDWQYKALFSCYVFLFFPKPTMHNSQCKAGSRTRARIEKSVARKWQIKPEVLSLLHNVSLAFYLTYAMLSNLLAVSRVCDAVKDQKLSYQSVSLKTDKN